MMKHGSRNSFFETHLTVVNTGRGRYDIRMSGDLYVTRNKCRNQIATRHASRGPGFKFSLNPTTLILHCSELRFPETQRNVAGEIFPYKVRIQDTELEDRRRK
jgi:hypothetical protein